MMHMLYNFYSIQKMSKSRPLQRKTFFQVFRGSFWVKTYESYGMTNTIFWSVTGNCIAKQGTLNVLRLLKSNEISLPVHIGQSDVLVPMAKPKPCSEYHGKDGFGDVPDFYPTMNDVDMDNLKSETAVQARDIDFTVKSAQIHLMNQNRSCLKWI